MHSLVSLAKEAVENFVQHGTVIVPSELTGEMKERAGVFVSLKIGGMLRGCIGTFEPVRASIAEEVIANAISSATRDPRFIEVRPNELPLLEYSVDVLTPPEPVISLSDLDPRKYGVIVKSGVRRGLLLPDLEGVDSVDDQIVICMQKAGISHLENLELYRFEVKRYT